MSAGDDLPPEVPPPPVRKRWQHLVREARTARQAYDNDFERDDVQRPKGAASARAEAEALIGLSIWLERYDHRSTWSHGDPSPTIKTLHKWAALVEDIAITCLVEAGGRDWLATDYPPRGEQLQAQARDLRALAQWIRRHDATALRSPVDDAIASATYDPHLGEDVDARVLTPADAEIARRRAAIGPNEARIRAYCAAHFTGPPPSATKWMALSPQGAALHYVFDFVASTGALPTGVHHICVGESIDFTHDFTPLGAPPASPRED